MSGSLLKMSHLMVVSLHFFPLHKSHIKMSHLMSGSLLKMSHLMVGSLYILLLPPESYKDVPFYVQLFTEDVPSYGRIIIFFPLQKSHIEMSHFMSDSLLKMSHLMVGPLFFSLPPELYKNVPSYVSSLLKMSHLIIGSLISFS